jgi:hypothetical protein
MDLLDLKKMKKIACDDKTSTFEHEKGHKIVVAHNALPKLLKAQIKLIPLAEGGEVKGVHKAEYEDSPKGVSKAGEKAREAKADSDAGDTKSAKKSIAAAKDEHHKMLVQIVADRGDRRYLDEGTPDAPLAADPSLPNVPQLDVSQNAIGTPQQELLGERQKAATEAALAQKEQPLVEQNANKLGTIADQQKAAPELQAQEIENYRDYLAKNPITPRKPGILNGLGLILGGIGAGQLGSTHNPALDVFNAMAEREMKAQEENTGNQKNLVDAYDKLTGNRLLSLAASKISVNDQLLAALKNQALKLGTPTAVAAYNQVAGAKAAERAIQMATFYNASKAIHQAGGPNLSPATQKATQKPQATLGEGPTPIGQPQPESSYNPQDYHDPLDTPIKPLLTPDAKSKFFAANPKMNPLAEADYGDLKDQYNKLDQYDSVLSNLRDSYKTMADNATGITRLEKGAKISGIPLLGDAISGVLSYASAGDPKVQAYKRALARVRGDIRVAFPEMSQDEVDKMLVSSSPVSGQNRNEMFEGRSNIEGTLKNAAKKGVAKKYDMVNTP